MNKRLWHRLSDEEYKEFMSKSPTIQDVFDEFLQPGWCAMPEALHPTKGCEKLIDPETRQDISVRNCDKCGHCRRHRLI